MAAGARVFLPGNYTVNLLNVNTGGAGTYQPPPKPLLIGSPTSAGEFPVLLFLHGYLLLNYFYSDLIRQIASHGFIVVAPQLYTIAGPDVTSEIKAAAATAEWLPSGLPHVLPPSVIADITRLGVAGHSRGGKAAFALVLGLVTTTSLRFSAIMGIDPVDGTAKGMQTTPPVLTYIPKSLDTKGATMIIGSGLGELYNGLLPPCAPTGVNHREFFAESLPPSCYLVAGDYGHMDMLDDDTPGLRGQTTYFLCKNGRTRAPMRRFVGGAAVAFFRAFLAGDYADLLALKGDLALSPVRLSNVSFVLAKEIVQVPKVEAEYLWMGSLSKF